MTWLLETERYVARWECAHLENTVGWFIIAGDAILAVAYALIPVFIYRFWKIKKDVLPFAWMLWMFMAFIWLCALSHVADMAIFWVPVYRLVAAERIVAGVVSLATLWYLPRTVRHFERYSPPHEVERINKQLAITVAELADFKAKQLGAGT